MASNQNSVARAAPIGTTDASSRSAERSELVDLYRTQVLARTFDEKAVSLHGQGRIGTYAPLQGQEAAQVGAAAALAERDYCLPTYRDHAIYMHRGIDPEMVLLHLMGQGNYIDREDGDPRTFPPTIPIATQLPHAVGLGMAADYRGDDVATLVSFGDGATSEGDFHEGMNFAGVFETPTVFFCQNNGYAISVPTERQTATETIAQKANAYGFEGVRVNGNDVIAVKQVVEEALAAARNGSGPTLIEALTYRQGAHTTTDDPSRYRDGTEDIPDWRMEDPLDITRERLERDHGWTHAEEDELRNWAEKRVATAVANAEEATGLDPEAIFAHVYADTPAHLRDQQSSTPSDPRVKR